MTNVILNDSQSAAKLDALDARKEKRAVIFIPLEVHAGILGEDPGEIIWLSLVVISTEG
jgi:hypothetical protein